MFSFEIQNYTILAIGITLICFQILELIRILVPSKIIQTIPHWKFFIRPSTVKLERATKLAAARKVEGMVNNALRIHEACSIQSGISSSTKMGSALLAYQAKEHDVEPCGGIRWAWTKMYNGTLYREEGVWLHARLIASNIAQLFVAATIAVGWGLLTFQVINTNTAPSVAPSASPSTRYPTFSPSTPHPSFPTFPITAFPTANYSYATYPPSSSSSSGFVIRKSE
jgi:hypothetical protein